MQGWGRPRLRSTLHQLYEHVVRTLDVGQAASTYHLRERQDNPDAGRLQSVRSPSRSSTANPKCFRPSRFSSATGRLGDEPSC